MAEEVEQLKKQFPLLDYLRRNHWMAHRVGGDEEFVGLCPLRSHRRPSFYVNAQKNLFYCHGCGQGGDLIRFLELSEALSFRQSVAYLQQCAAGADQGNLLEDCAAFYQMQLHRHPEAVQYLQQRGLHDPTLIEELGIGYAPGGNLLRHLACRGYSLEALLHSGLLNNQGRETFCRRLIFPCRQHNQIVNFYGRSTGTAFPHRLLPRPKGGLFAWETVSRCSIVILVEGLFDLAALWQAGFRNTTCAIGTNLSPAQMRQLTSDPARLVYIAFDQDQQQAGQQKADRLGRILQSAGMDTRLVQLPYGHDPSSYFASGATAADFDLYLQQAQPL
jgi:DNA primase